jgi:hypothetical protein
MLTVKLQHSTVITVVQVLRIGQGCCSCTLKLRNFNFTPCPDHYNSLNVEMAFSS